MKMKIKAAFVSGIALVTSSVILTRFEAPVHDFVQGLFVGAGIALSLYALVCMRVRRKVV
ncbi:hypothetical protein [Paenibacillus sp. HB172176]|uniref:hypothetical protein n=1 Tax=Paenibacillus sp. HB172176 TaxID=2493690 RepID=UPI00143A40E3|nr:hypothetical protein [Paenibacillus sp. HB172176]